MNSVLCRRRGGFRLRNRRSELLCRKRSENNVTGGDNIKLSQEIKQETRSIAIGVGIMSVIMVAVFAVLNAAELVQVNLMTVVLGAVLGAGYAICNFLLLGIAVQRAVDSGDPKQGQLIVQGSYTKRLLLMAVVLIIGFKAPCFNGLAVALPQLFPRVVIFVKSLFQSKRKEEE